MGLLADLFGWVNDGSIRQHSMSWSDLHRWLNTAGNPNNVGKGFVGNSLGGFPDAYVEVTKNVVDKDIRIEAALYLDARKKIAARKQVWHIKKMDAELSERFARGQLINGARFIVRF